MRLRQKTLLTVGAVLSVMILFVVIIASGTLSSEALALERKKVQDDTRVALNAMVNMEEDLQKVLQDYAYWDDTYAFVQGSAPGYIDSNLIDQTFMNVEVNYILFFDVDQNLYYGKGYDFESLQPLNVSSSLVGLLVDKTAPPYLNDTENPQVGIASLDEGLAVVALSPIRDSVATAPSAGTMVMVRLLTEQRVVDFSDSLINEVDIVDADEPGWDGLTEEVRDTVLSSDEIQVVPVNSTAIEGYVGLESFDGETVAILSIRESREIYQEAIDSVDILITSMVLVGAVFGALTLLITDRLFMRRVSWLSKQVGEIGLNGDVSRRVKIDGSDELSDLADETNKTLDALETLDRELRESEKRYRAIVNDQSELIVRTMDDGTITFANEAMLRELKMRPEDVVGKKVQDILPKPIIGPLLEHIESVAKSGESLTREYFLHTSDGANKWYSWTVRSIVDRDKGSKEVQGVGRDLTEQKLADLALQQANKKLSLLASVTRHDVMNQLTVAHGFVVIAKLQTSDKKVAEQLSKAEQAIQLIHGYLEFTRDYQRVGMVRPVWIDLVEAVEKASSTLTANGIRLTADLADYEISCDPLVEKVFHNILDNSVRHGGKVSEVRVSAREEYGNLLIIFQDDGVGVSDREKELIFEAGYGSNTGYGLFLAREILGTSNITIKETGKQGEGARFEVLVPKGAFRRRSG